MTQEEKNAVFEEAREKGVTIEDAKRQINLYKRALKEAELSSEQRAAVMDAIKLLNEYVQWLETKR